MRTAEVLSSTPSSGTDVATQQPMIQVEGLTKYYGSVEALRDVSFSVGKGEIVGFLGPNGAGKTTTMKILTGFISATSGTFRVAGYDGSMQSLQVRRNIGYLPENAPLYPDMGMIEYLNFVCAIRRIPRSQHKIRIDEMVTKCGLGPMAHKDIGQLSKGYRQRVGLAQAMIHQPPILILDEPTSGLDPNQIVEIRNLIKDLGKERTIILSTHNLPEVQMTCTRMIIISEGRKVADGTAEELQNQSSENSGFVVEFDSRAGASSTDIQAALSSLAGVDSVADHPPTAGGHCFSLAGTGSGLSSAIFELAVSSGWVVTELRRDTENLEKIFTRLTQY
jgi:ABC-2 type transport system ATP-binding protein